MLQVPEKLKTFLSFLVKIIKINYLKISTYKLSVYEQVLREF